MIRLPCGGTSDSVGDDITRPLFIAERVAQVDHQFRRALGLPAAGLAGTVDGQGGVHPIEVDEDALTGRREQTPDPEAPIEPTQVTAAPPQRPVAPVPASIPPAPSPAPSGGDQVPPTSVPADPPPGPGPGDASTPTTTAPTTTTTTTTTVPTTTTTVPATTTTAPTTTTSTTAPPPQAVPVPDVRNRPVEEACTTLQAAGFTCDRQPSGEYGAPALTVLGQAPAAATSAAPGATVAISFHESEGVVVPPAGDRGADACDPIEDAGLTCNLVPVNGADYPTPDEVYGQAPVAGTRVGPGSTVNVEHEARPFANLWQVDDPNSYRLYLTPDAGTAANYEAQGWRRTSLGQVFLDAAPGTWPIYCFQPNGAGSNESNVYIPDNAAPNLPYHEGCGLVAYGPVDQHPSGRSHQVWGFVAHSDHVYATSSNDSVGRAHLATDANSLLQPIFALFSD